MLSQIAKDRMEVLFAKKRVVLRGELKKAREVLQEKMEVFNKARKLRNNLLTSHELNNAVDEGLREMLAKDYPNFTAERRSSGIDQDTKNGKVRLGTAYRLKSKKDNASLESYFYLNAEDYNSEVVKKWLDAEKADDAARDAQNEADQEVTRISQEIAKCRLASVESQEIADIILIEKAGTSSDDEKLADLVFGKIHGEESPAVTTTPNA